MFFFSFFSFSLSSSSFSSFLFFSVLFVYDNLISIYRVKDAFCKMRRYLRHTNERKKHARCYAKRVCVFVCKSLKGIYQKAAIFRVAGGPLVNDILCKAFHFASHIEKWAAFDTLSSQIRCSFFTCHVWVLFVVVYCFCFVILLIFLGY